MVGGVGEGFASYLKILRYVGERRIDRASLIAWLKSEFQLEDS